MSEKGRYSTKQQGIILEYLKQNKDTFYTIDEFMDLLYKAEIHIGRTTIYRALERLQKDGAVLKIPSVEGAPAQYRYAQEDERRNYGKLVCLRCGHSIPLQCGCIDHFMSHVLEEHGFRMDQEHTIFYGYCEKCRER